MDDYDVAYTLLAGLGAVEAGRLLSDPAGLREWLATYRLDLDESEVADLREAFRA